MGHYATSREKLVYYKYIRSLLSILIRPTDTIIDVGSYGTDLISFLPCKAKYSLDIQEPLAANGVIPIKADFLQWEPTEHFNIACCFQVLEHLKDAPIFAKKLLSIADLCIISVPYKWKKGQCKYHMHDPVDEDKLFSWFGIYPLYMQIVFEADNRLICIYADDIREKELDKINGGHFNEFMLHNVDSKEHDNKISTLDISCIVNLFE